MLADVTIVPLVLGKVNVVVPDTAGADSVTVPDVSPAMTTLLRVMLLLILLQ